MSTTSRYLNHQPCYSIDLNEQQEPELYDHQVLLHHHHNTTTPVSFSSLEPPYSSSSSSFSLTSLSSPLRPICSNPVQDHVGYIYMGSQLHPSPYNQEVGNFGSYECESYDPRAPEINDKVVNRPNLKFTICKKEDQDCGGEINGSPVKWMPLRIMKRMMRGDEDQKNQVPPIKVEPENRDLISKTPFAGSQITNNNNNNNENTTIRVCSDCNTTKTPLWRSGPRGPKSLCNACGIRQRKARRAMAAATNGSMFPNSMMRTGNGQKKAPNSNNNGFGTQKKRSKVVKPSRDHHHNNTQRKIWFEEFALRLSKKLSLHQVFPKEEKEAAILLMALSCGFVHG